MQISIRFCNSDFVMHMVVIILLKMHKSQANIEESIGNLWSQ